MEWEKSEKEKYMYSDSVVSVLVSWTAKLNSSKSES